MTNFYVNCSGASFSCLQYELINNKKWQEGFLLGNIEKYTSHQINDLEMDNEDINICINVTGFVPCSMMGIFYSGSGRINTDKIKQCLHNNTEKVVGWYRCRKFVDTIFLKEMRIHEQLKDLMSHTDGQFLLGLFSRIQPADSGTMDVIYKFQIMLNNNDFKVIPLKIVNMNDTSTSQYIQTPSSVLYNSDSLDIILKSVKNLQPGVEEAECLHNGLLKQLRSLLPKACSIQEQHSKLLQNVVKLREFCRSSGLKPDFQPKNSSCCDADDMKMAKEEEESEEKKSITGRSTKKVSAAKFITSAETKISDDKAKPKKKSLKKTSPRALSQSPSSSPTRRTSSSSPSGGSNGALKKETKQTKPSSARDGQQLPTPKKGTRSALAALDKTSPNVKEKRLEDVISIESPGY